MEEELKTDFQKGYDLRVLVEMWDRRVWAYEGERKRGALNVLWESILRWRKWKLTIYFPNCAGGVRVYGSGWVRVKG